MSRGGGGSSEPSHTHNYTYTYVDTDGGWKHNGHCDATGCDTPDVTGEACTPVANVCSKCNHNFTEAEILAKLFSLSGKDTINMKGTYSLTGKVIRIDTAYSTSDKNITFTIKFSDGKEVQAYRAKDAEGGSTNYASTVKPGDTVTVQGALKHFYTGVKEFDSGCIITTLTVGELTAEEKVAEVKAWLDLPEAQGNTITLPTAPTAWANGVTISWQSDNNTAAKIENTTLTLVPQTTITNVAITATIALSGVTSQTKTFKISVPAIPVAGQVVVTKTAAQLATAYNWSNSKLYASFALDDKITISSTSSSKTPNTGKYYSTNGGSWRLYSSEQAKMTITAASGYKLLAVKITFSEGALQDYENGVAKSVSGSSVTISATEKTFVTSIEVIYAPEAATAANISAQPALLPNKD